MKKNTLNELLENLSSIRCDDFPWIPESEQVISATTPYVLLAGNINISDAEYEAKESELIQTGYQEFLSKSDLYSIIENLTQQNSSYSDEQLYVAINHYWKNDAFIQL